MTEGTAIEIAKKMMLELGIGDDYIFRYRHFQIAPQKEVKIKGYNELYILLHPEADLKAYSKAGIYNIQDKGINEMQYVHRGYITLINQGKGAYLQVKVLQVIPKLKKDGRS